MNKNRDKIDRELVRKCCDGDRDAFSELVLNYRRPLYSYLLRLCNCRATADDLFQETLLKTWRALNRFQNEKKFASWLFCVAYNTAVDFFRSKNRFEKALIRYDRSQNEIPTPLEQMIHQESIIALHDAMQTLSEKQRHVFLLRMHGELTFKEIADLTDEPLNTVLSHMNYAVIKLKKIFGKQNNAVK